MYTVTKYLEISAAHKLDLPYDSPCKNLHGHNWQIWVTCQAKELNACGMVCDFAKISKFVKEKLDHKYINNVLIRLNPTAENIAKYICDNIENCVKVIVQESDGNTAIYERENI